MNVVDRTGSAGGALITPATGAVTGASFAFVQILEDNTEFDVLTNPLFPSGAGIGEDLASRTWKRGDVIPGCTTAVTLSAGAVLAINRA